MSETAQPSEPEQLRAQLDDHQRRITELEIESAFHRKTIDELDEVVRGQAERIDKLERRLADIVSEIGPETSD